MQWYIISTNACSLANANALLWSPTISENNCRANQGRTSRFQGYLHAQGCIDAETNTSTSNGHLQADQISIRSLLINRQITLARCDAIANWHNICQLQTAANVSTQEQNPTQSANFGSDQFSVQWRDNLSSPSFIGLEKRSTLVLALQRSILTSVAWCKCTRPGWGYEANGKHRSIALNLIYWYYIFI